MLFSPVTSMGPITMRTDLEILFSASLAALGDASEVARLQSIQSFASCAGPRGTYTTETFSQRAGKAGIRQRFSDATREPVNAFVHADRAWEISRSGKATPASPMLRSIIRAHQYQMMPIEFQTMFRGFALEEASNFEGRPSVRVSAKNDLGFQTSLFFDAESKLLSGTLMQIPGGSETIKTAFNEWRTVGNIKFPSVVTATDKRGDYVCRFDSITLNKVDPALFEVPPQASEQGAVTKPGRQAP